MRGKQAPKRDIKPDEIYNSVTVTKTINKVMKDGKRDTARTIVYTALEKLAEASKESPVKSLEKVLANTKPRVEVRSRRVGGANYQVPVPVREERQFALAIKWIIDSARSGRGKSAFADSFARELIAAYNNEGAAVKKREEVQKMADANKAFAQFA